MLYTMHFFLSISVQCDNFTYTFNVLKWISSMLNLLWSAHSWKICIAFLRNQMCVHRKKGKCTGKHPRVLLPQRGEWMKNALLSHLTASSCAPARCQYLMLMDGLFSITCSQCKLRWISAHVPASCTGEADTTVLKVMQGGLGKSSGQLHAHGCVNCVEPEAPQSHISRVASLLGVSV